MSERSPLLRTSPEPEPVSKSDTARSDEYHGKRTTVSLVRGVVISAALFVNIFLLTFGVSVITTTQSSIAADLGVTNGASWFVSVYLITGTSITPIAGKICQIFSPQSYLLYSTVIQAFGFYLTAFASSFTTFIIGRAICGIGAVAVTPVAFILVTKLAEQRRWAYFFGLLNCAYTAGIALGAVVGGALEPKIGWRAVFWIQIPVCLIASLVAYVAIPSQSGHHIDDEHGEMTVFQKVARIDYLGVVTLISAVVLLLYTLAAPGMQLAPLGLAIAFLIVFYAVEARWATDPIIPLNLIHSRAVVLTGISTIGFMSARWATLLYIPTYGIAVRGWTQSQAGLLLVPTNIGLGLGSVAVGWLHIKKTESYYFSNLVTFGIFVLEHLVLSQLATPDSPIWLLICFICLDGFVAGAALNYILSHLLHLTRPAQHIIVIPLNAMFRSLSGSIASSLCGGIFQQSLQASLREGFARQGLTGKDYLISQLLSRPLLVQSLEGLEHEIAVTSYSASIKHLIALGSLWVAAMLVFQSGTGWTAPVDESARKKEDCGQDYDETRGETEILTK